MGDLLVWDKTHLWHAFTQMAEYESLIVTRGQGCWLETIDGRRLLDGVSSLWCNVHGHRHPRIDAAIKAQLDEVAHVTLLGMSAPVTIRLARRLAEISPAGLEHVFFSDSGASAVEVALKMAFQYWRQKPNPEPQRTKYLALDNAYHGDTLGSVSVGGVARFHQMFEPLLFDVLRLPQPSVDHLPAGIARGDACDYYLQQFDAALALHGHELAAVVIEPLVQCAAGMIMHPPGYLRGIRQLCTKHGVLLIADEVAVGMGRTGTMFACEQEQVSPDFLCLAKGITGGYLPLAATLTTTEIWNAFLGTYAESKTFFHGHTYGGNPLGAAAAMATLDVFEQEQTLVHLQDKIARLSKHLARLAEHPHVGSVRQCGLIAGVELVRDKATGQPFAWEEKRGFRVCAEAMRHGVWIRPLGSVVVLMPPLAVSHDELDLLCAAVEQGILVATGTSAGS